MFNSFPAALFILQFMFFFTPLYAQNGSQPGNHDTTFQRKILNYDSLSVAYFQRRQEFVDRFLEQFRQQSASHSLKFNRYSKANFLYQIPPDSFKIVYPRDRDYIGAELRHRYSNVPPILDFSALARSGVALLKSKKNKTRRPRIDQLPIPNALELKVLVALWARGKRTGPEIYAKLDSNVNMTAEMLWKILRNMAKKGYLAEKLISPQNLFSFVTPVGVFPVELSGKNRRNQVYEYTALISSREVLQYLEARRYLMMTEEKSANNRKGSADEMAKLIHLTLKLLQQSREKTDFN